jgi:hypothetical protein
VIAEGGAHRAASFAEGPLIQTFTPEVATMAESWLLSVQRYPHKACMGSKWGQFINYEKVSLVWFCFVFVILFSFDERLISVRLLWDVV